MRVLVLLLALGGGVTSAVFGMLVKEAIQGTRDFQIALRLDREFERGKLTAEELRKEVGRDVTTFRESISRLREAQTATYLLLAVFPLAVLGGLLALDGKRLLAVPLFLVPGGMAFYFATRGDEVKPGLLLLSGLSLCPLLLAGLLAPLISSEARDESEEEARNRSQKPMRKPDNKVATVLAGVLVVGGTVALSLLAALDVIHYNPKPDPDIAIGSIHGDRRQPDGPVPPRDQGEKNPPDQIDPAEDARLAAKREEIVKAQRTQEVQLIESLRQSKGADTKPPVLGILKGHKQSIDRLLFSPDGKVLASSDEATICLWDLRAGKANHILKPPRVLDMVFVQDGQQLLACCEDSTLRGWDVKSGAAKQPIPLKSGLNPGTPKVHCKTAAFSTDGKILVSDGADERQSLMRSWDTDTGSVRTNVPVFVGELAYSPDGRTFASVGPTRTVLLWDPQTGVQKRTLRAEWVGSLTFSADGKMLATAAHDASRDEKHSLKLWEARTGKELFSVPKGNVSQPGLAFTPDGAFLAVTARSKDRTASGLRLLDTKTGQERHKIEKLHEADITEMIFSPGGRLLVVGTTDGQIALIETSLLLDSK